MDSFLSFIYAICVITILSLPSIAILIHLIWEKKMMCPSEDYSAHGINKTNIKFLMWQLAIVAIVCSTMIGMQSDMAGTLIILVCLANFINSMLFWNMCNRCEGDKKCQCTRKWLIVLGFVNILLPVLYFIQQYLHQAKRVYPPQLSIKELNNFNGVNV